MDSSSASKYSGIVNGGGTCYLNSALQAMFHIPKFRKLVYDLCISDDGAAASPASSSATTPTSPAPQSSSVTVAVPPRKSRTDREILLALQKVFVAIEKKGSPASTSELTKAFGWSDSQRSHQHDAHEFVQKLLESLEKIMKGTPQEKDISDLFGYKFLRYTRCLDDGVVVRRPTDLTAALELVVEGFSTLEESLVHFVKPTPLDDKYKRDEADGSVTEHPAENGEALLSTPPVLVIHPIRVTYSPTTYARVMVPNEWRFPEVLDISTALHSTCEVPSDSTSATPQKASTDTSNENTKNTKEEEDEEKTGGEMQEAVPESVKEQVKEMERDHNKLTTKDPKMRYVLRSVVVHSGYATSGHYYSFVRFSSTDWVEFNDTMVIPSSKTSMERVAFSSSTSTATRATLLVYIRSDMMEEVLCPVTPLSMEAIQERTLLLPRPVHYLISEDGRDGTAQAIDTLIASRSPVATLPNVTLPKGATVGDLVTLVNEKLEQGGKERRHGTRNIILIVHGYIKKVFTTVQLTSKLVSTDDPHYYFFSDSVTYDDGEHGMEPDDNVETSQEQPLPRGKPSFPSASSDGNVFLVMAVISTNGCDDDFKLWYLGSFSTEEATLAELRKVSPTVEEWSFGYIICYNKVSLCPNVVKHGHITVAWPATMTPKDAEMVFNDRVPGSVELVVLDAAMRPCRRLETLTLKRRMKFSTVQKLAHRAISAAYDEVQEVSHSGDKRARSIVEDGGEQSTEHRLKEKKTESQLKERKEKEALPSASRIAFYVSDSSLADAPKKFLVPMRQAAVTTQLRDTTSGKETKSPNIPPECNAESFLTDSNGWVPRLYCSFLPRGAPSLSHIADDKCVEVAVRLSYQYTRRCFIATETSLDLAFPSSSSTTTTVATSMARSPVSPRTIARRTAAASTLRSLIEEAWSQLKDEIEPSLRTHIEERLEKSLDAAREDKTLEKRPGASATKTTYTRGVHTSPSFDPVFRLLRLDSFGDSTTISVNWCNQLSGLLPSALYVLDLLPEAITSLDWPAIALKSTISDASFANKTVLPPITTVIGASKGASGFGARTTVGADSFANITPTQTPSFTSANTVTTATPATVSAEAAHGGKKTPSDAGEDSEQPPMMATTAPPAGMSDAALQSPKGDTTPATSTNPPPKEYVARPHCYWVTVKHIDRAQQNMMFSIPFTAVVELRDDTTGREVLLSILTQLGLKDKETVESEEWNPSTLPFCTTSSTTTGYQVVPSLSDAMDSWKLVIPETSYSFTTWPLEKSVSQMKQLKLNTKECLALVLDHAGPAKQQAKDKFSFNSLSWRSNRETGIKIMNIDT